MPTLTHDGPAVPEQISWKLDASSYSASATATVRYRLTSGPGAWVTAHPGYRAIPAYTDTIPSIGSVTDIFAFMIIDLEQGTSYDVEVTVTDGAATVYAGTFVTRSLPGSAPAPNKFATSGQSQATIQATINGLVAGDHLQFANGTYTLTPDGNGDSLILSNLFGTHGNEIFISGASRTGVIFSCSRYPFCLFGQTSFVVFENMTDHGQFNSVTNSYQAPVSAFLAGRNTGSWGPYEEITVRNITARGVDGFVGSQSNAYFKGLLVYHNDAEGNNVWIADQTDHNYCWDDDGINLNGQGNCAFYNTLKGFGDSISFANHYCGGSTPVCAENYDNYAWGNDISNSLDDGTEMDHSFRNTAFYDNRIHNAMTSCSVDPVYAGPILYARNVTINTARALTFKLNTPQSGYFIYSNTIIRTESHGGSAESGWYNSGNGGSNQQRSYGYRNNLLIYHGTGTQMIRLDTLTHNPIDFDHNGWSDNGTFSMDNQGPYANLVAAQAGFAATTPIFSGITHRMTGDVIVGDQPFTTMISLGSDYYTEITARYTPTLSGGSTAKNAGVAIPNITDGFSGAAPDMGAIISGLTAIVWGDPSLVVEPPSGTSSELLPRGRRFVFMAPA